MYNLGAFLLVVSVWLLPPPLLSPARAAASEGLKIELIQSPKGIKAWFLQDNSSPVLSLSFAFKGGSLADPQGKEGVARLASMLLLKGAGDLDAAAFAAKLQDLAVDLEFQATHDTLSGTLKTLKQNRAEAFNLLKLALLNPQLTDTSFERSRSQLLTALATAMQNPKVVANRTLLQRFFGDKSYGRPIEGTSSSIQATLIEDIRTYLKECLARDNLVIGITGDCHPSEVSAWLDEVFGDLPAKARPLDIKLSSAAPEGKTVVIETAVPQSTVHFLQESLPSHHPDFLKSVILITILGNGSTSRLYQEVREKRGLAYDVNLFPEGWHYSGVVYGMLGTVNERVNQSIDVVRQEWRQVQERGVTAHELEEAKAYLKGSFPLHMTNAEEISSLLLTYQLAGRKITYINERNSRIDEIQLKEINAFARNFLKPDALNFVIVGQPAPSTSQDETKNAL